MSQQTWYEKQIKMLAAEVDNTGSTESKLRLICAIQQYQDLFGSLPKCTSYKVAYQKLGKSFYKAVLYKSFLV